MNEGWKRFHGTDEEVMWRIQVLKRTSRLCAAKAKELERMAKADGDMPAMDHASLMDVLKRIDNVMEWRFVNALGEVVLDADILAESIDCEDPALHAAVRRERHRGHRGGRGGAR